MMVKFSVIVPVYNVEKYLSTCLDSLINQTLKDIEIICINDGSQDGSLDILKDYAQKDKRIKIINQKNQGVSSARNNGIAAVQGQYLAFLDGDDFFETTLLEKTYNEISRKKADVLIFGTYEVNSEGHKNIRWDMPLLKDFAAGKFNIAQMDLFIHLLHSLWDKIYRTDFIKKNKILFPIDIKVAEDNIFVLETYLKHATYAFLPECLYNYRVRRADSATTNNKDCIINQISAFKCLEQKHIYQSQDMQTKRIVINQFLDGCIWLINQSVKINKRHYLAQIKKFIRYLENEYSKNEIKKMPNYGKLRKLFKEKNSLLENIFSLKNSKDRKYKIITFFFIKLKIRRKKAEIPLYQQHSLSKQQIPPSPVDIFAKANNRSVLIFEAQPHHGECLPAYIKYFNDLGYHVDLLILREIIEQNPFCRLPENSDFSIIEGTWDNRAEILKNEKILNYKHILIATAICYYSPQVPVIDEFQIFKKHPSVLIVEHDLRDIDINHEREFLEKNRISTLWKFPFGTMINPCYFGRVEITSKNVPTFIVVGKIEKKRKNHDLLFESISRLLLKTQNFHVIIIGEVENSDLTIPEKIRPYITITGYVNFPEMYQYMEKADFFLPLLDDENKDHERYLTSGVTGSLQLILGFRKIALIQEKFAKFYEFNAQNAIIYKKNLEDAMYKAVEMSPKLYQEMQDNLDEKAISIYAKSERNLRRMLP